MRAYTSSCDIGYLQCIDNFVWKTLDIKRAVFLRGLLIISRLTGLHLGALLLLSAVAVICCLTRLLRAPASACSLYLLLVLDAAVTFSLVTALRK